MKVSVPLSEITCELCRLDTDRPYETQAPYVMVPIELPEEDKETITVLLDVKRIEWQRKEQGCYYASAVIANVCPYCKSPHDLKRQLEAPKLLLKDIGNCEICAGKLNLQSECIEFVDTDETGPTLRISGYLVCNACAHFGKELLEVSTPVLSSLMQSEILEIGFTNVGVEINGRIFTAKTSSALKMTNAGNEIDKEKISILFLAADPSDAARLRLGEEFREIQEKLRQSKYRERITLGMPQLSARPSDLCQALLDMQPHIVHFSGHGKPSGVLCFEDQSGQTKEVSPDVLAKLFEQFANIVNCVLLNACHSKEHATAIAEHISYAIGMNQEIGDKAAIAFSTGFYQALGAGRSIEDAYTFGCLQIRLLDIPEHLTPVLTKKWQK